LAYQQKPHWCGPAALQSALQIHGARIGQGRLAGLLGTGLEGTDEQQMTDALDALGCQWDVLETNRKADARAWLVDRSPIAPLIMCVDAWQHWVCVAGVCGPRMWLLDPAREEWNKAGQGRWALLPKTILKRWKAPRRDVHEGGLYYGIAVLTRPNTSM